MKRVLYIVVVVFMLGGFLAQTASQVYADSLSQTDIDAINGWANWTAGGGCGDSSGGGGDLVGNDNMQKAFNFYVGKGLTPIQSAGIIGNYVQESGVNPTSVNTKSGASGIAQWLGGRYTNLLSFAQSQGKSWTDLGVQLDYSWKELTESYSSVLNQIKSASTIDDVAKIFSDGYEKAGAAETNLTNRIGKGKAVLALYGGSIASADSSSASTSGCGGSGTFTWPATVSGSTVTSCFGPRIDPITGSKSVHPGDDIAQAINSPVYAAADGTVVYEGPMSGYGNNFVVIDHGSGTYTSYGHMNGANVKKGDAVKQGQQIGIIGSQGASTGAHVHFNLYLNGHSYVDGINGNVEPLNNGLQLPAGVKITGENCGSVKH